jgi:hypothetical protein
VQAMVGRVRALTRDSLCCLVGDYEDLSGQ